MRQREPNRARPAVLIVAALCAAVCTGIAGHAALPVSGEIFAEASSNHPEFCVASSSGNKTLYLVHIPTKRYADLGVRLDSYGRIGGPWIEFDEK
jgi:hypothetical protein